MLEIEICEHCCKELIEFGYPAMTFYQNVLEFMCLKRKLPIFPSDMIDEDLLRQTEEIISFLESKRYILTCEISEDQIKIQPMKGQVFFPDKNIPRGVFHLDRIEVDAH